MGLTCIRPFPPLPQRDGCPYVINIGAARSDWYYDKKKYGFKKRD